MSLIDTKIFRQDAKFIIGATVASDFSKVPPIPQIAFMGKSNVGKSTLINAICRQHNLARTSNTPGRTRQINFFSLLQKLLIVDLPGYGFAKVPHSEKQNWQKLILYYLQNNDNLRLVNLLIDSRRGLKENDLDIIRLLQEYGVNFQVVFTKSDKNKNIDELMIETKNLLIAINCDVNIIATSSSKREGIKNLQHKIIEVVQNNL